MRTLLDRLTPRFAGRTVAVLASGPSLTREIVDTVRAAEIPAVVTNRTYELAPWADALVGNDVAWWLATPGAHAFAGAKVCLQECPLPHVVTPSGQDLHDARDGGNSGFTAVWLAAKAGAARILLCGVDMRGDHWHAEHLSPPLRNTLPGRYPVWIARFEKHAPDVEILNCTPGSDLRCFPFSDLDDALARAADLELA